MKFRKETEFQETEIGKIPKEWGLAKLEKIAKIITGPFGSQLKKSELTNHGIKVYTQENVLERNFEIGNLYISEEKFKELKNFEVTPGDVLLTIRGTIGKSIKVPTGITRGIIHTNLAIIRLEKKEVLPDFVELVFNESEILMEQVRRIHSATTIPALYGRTLKQIKIMLPPLNEQKAITDIFSTVNRAIELYREEMTRLDRLKRGLMGELLTGRIRVREENGRLSFYRETELQETEIGEIPRDWKVVKLRAISTFAKRGKTPKYGNSELLVIKTAHNYPDRIRFEEAPRASEEFQAKLPKEFYLRPEDILVNSTGTGSVGRVGFFKGYHKPCTVDGHITILRTNQSMAIPKYVFYYLASHYGQSALLSKASGSTHQVELYVNEILDLTLPLPSLEEQREIAEVLSMIDQVIELHSEGITKLERLKRGLMDLLLTGKVRVVDGDVGS